VFGFIRNMKVARAIGRDDFATAIRYLKEGIAADGESAYYLYMIAECHENIGSDQEALDYGTRALAHDPCDLDTLQLVTRIYQDRGEDDRAYLYVCRALENPPEPLEDVPRFFMAVWRLLSIIFPRLKTADPVKAIHSYNKEQQDWQAWAEDWKEGYEKKYGGPPGESIH
jgi:tetratricopeptide (TPR) repeat protein